MSCEAFKKGYNISYIPCGQLANLMRLTVECMPIEEFIQTYGIGSEPSYSIKSHQIQFKFLYQNK